MKSKPKAVIYLRVSTPAQMKQDKLSLENQREKTTKHCNDEGFELSHEYMDAGLSGSKDDRPNLQELLAAAKRREFQHVVVNDITRFGRSASDLLRNVNKLRDSGINFHSVKNRLDLASAQGRFFFHILVGMAEMEAETLKIRMGEVKLAKLRLKRIILGKLAYGYRWNDETEQIEVNGKDEDGNYTGEAAIFLRIVKMYVDLNKSLQDIAIAFNKEAIPSREGRKWHSGTLKNFFAQDKTIYCGSTKIKIREEIEGEDGKKTREIVEEVEFECEPLLTRDQWQKIQDRMASGRVDRSGRPMVGADRFILRNLIKCGVCGNRVGPRHITNGQTYYACHWKSAGAKHREENDNHPRCTLPHIPSKKLDQFVYGYILFLLQYEEDPEAESSFYKGLVSDEQYDNRIKELEQEIQIHRDSLARNERGLSNTRKSKEAPGFRDFEGYNKEVNQYLDTIALIKSQIERLAETIKEIRKARADQEQFREIAQSEAIIDIRDKLYDLPNEDRHRLVAGLLDGDIVITPPTPDAKLDRNSTSDIKDWVKFKIRPNMAILQDILGIPGGDDDPGGGIDGGSNNCCSDEQHLLPHAQRVGP
jgi:DNA invertase Pin-like site-specific DNA recombinase